MKKKFNGLHILYALFILSWLVLSLEVKWWKASYPIIRWDVISYYGYLPATVIFRDVHLRYADTLPGLPIWFEQAPNGERVFKTSGGMAMMYFPFFVGGHLVAHVLGYPTHGYSKPYEIAIALAALTYLLLGIYFLRKFLQFFQNTDSVLFWTLLFVLFGGNALYYVAVEPGMPHVYIFFLVSVFLFLTVKWYSKPSVINSLLLGFAAGLLSLIRPTNIIWILFWLLYDVGTLTSLINRIRFLLRHAHLVLVIGITAFAVWLPQLVYWYEVTGKWLYFSYGEERFFFTRPHVFDALFSYRKGFLVYAPLMVLSFLGFVGLYRSKKAVFLPTLLVVALFVYVYASWWSWWFGGSYGMRAYIDMYPLLALPMLFSVEWIIKQRKQIRLMLLSLAILLMAYQLMNTFKYIHGSIHWDAMSKKVFWMNFLRIYPTDHMELYLEHPSYKAALKAGEKKVFTYGELLTTSADTLCLKPGGVIIDKHFPYAYGFGTHDSISNIHRIRANNITLLTNERKFSPPLLIYHPKQGDVFFVTAKVSVPNALVLVLQDYVNPNKLYLARKRTLHVRDKWYEVALFTRLQEDIDTLAIYGEAPPGKKILVNDFCVFLLRNAVVEGRN